MRQLRISRGGLELASVSLRQPVSTFGRSPTCDGVLRAPGVRPVHFLLESQGAESGKWALFDISDESGEGIVLGSARVEFKGFFFEVSEAALDAADEIGGGIQRSARHSVSEAGGPVAGRLVEALRIRRDSGAVQEISHLRVPGSGLSRSRRLKPFEGLQAVDVIAQKGQIAIEFSLEGGSPVVIKNSEQIPMTGKMGRVELTPSDWVRMEFGPDDLYFRWVAPAAKVPVPREVIGSPVLRFGGLLGVLVAALAAAWIAWKVGHPSKPVILEPPRVATIEVKQAPPPPPPEKLPPRGLEQMAPKSGAAAAPKFAVRSRPTRQAGLNAPVPPTDVNQLGLLGALKSSAPQPGAGVRADQIFNDSIITQAVAGKTGSIALKTPPSGALDVGKSGGAQGAKGDGLQALSTTLAGGSEFAPKEVGAVGRAGGAGSGLGSGLNAANGIGEDGTGRSAMGGLQEANGTDVQGGLDRETVRRVIVSNRGRIRACYERALLSQPKLAGRVVTQFEISPKGTVLSASVKSSDAASGTLESCLVDVVRGMEFPAAPTGKGTQVVYPFVFQARSG